MNQRIAMILAVLLALMGLVLAGLRISKFVYDW